MGGGPYLVLLFVGAVIVVVDGQLILRNAPAYLADAFGDPRRARRVTGLVVMFFHLVMLGVVALVASMGLGGGVGVPAMVSRIGVLLLLTAVGHGVTLMILSRVARQEATTELAEERLAAERNVAGPPASRPASGTAAQTGRLVGPDGRSSELPASADVPRPTPADGEPRKPPTEAGEL